MRVQTRDLAAREEKLEALQKKLTDSVGALVTGDDWKRALEFAAKFRSSPMEALDLVAQGIGRVNGEGGNVTETLKEMGIKGTEAAKEAAEIVLMDDNFAPIVAAVHEGRTVHDNIRKVIAWTLPTNGGEALTVIMAILLNFALPMTPVQILWVNLLLAATLGLVLAFEPSEPGVMARRPRHAMRARVASLPKPPRCRRWCWRRWCWWCCGRHCRPLRLSFRATYCHSERSEESEFEANR